MWGGLRPSRAAFGRARGAYCIRLLLPSLRPSFAGVACIVGPLIAAQLYEGGGVGGWGYFGFGALEIWVAAMAAASSVSALGIALVKPSSRRKQD